MDLANCAEDVLQAVINRCDRDDLFLLRLVNRRFRTAVNRRIRRIGPGPQWLPKLPAECPNVEVLDVRDCDGAEELPATLQALPRLRELLHLDWCGIEMAPLPGVTRLRLWRYDDEILDGLATTFPTLQTLQLASGGLSGAKLPGIVSLAGTLTALELGGVTVCNMEVLIGLRALNTGRLDKLRISESIVHSERDSSEDEDASEGPGPSHDFYRQLAAFTSLRTLHLDYIEGLAAEGVEQLATLTRLTSLRLGGLFISSVALVQLTGLTGLAELSVSHAAGVLSEPFPRLLRDEDLPSLLQVLAQFPRLAQLNIYRCRGEVRAEELAALTALTRLDAGDTTVLEAPGTLDGLTRLRELDLGHSIKSEAELRHLSGLVSLTRLSLGRVLEKGDIPLRDGLRWLAGMTALQDLDIHSGEPGFGGIRLLRGAMAHLARLPGLRRLSLPELEAPEELQILEGLQLQQLKLPAFTCYKVTPRLELAVQRHDREPYCGW